MKIGRRQALAGGMAAGGLAAAPRARAAVPRFEPPTALVEAARRDGGFVNYTAQIEDLELETIAAFNKRFPFVKVEIMHLPGGQLIERIKAEIAANKLVADLIDHSEPSLLAAIERLPPLRAAECGRLHPGDRRVPPDLAAADRRYLHRLEQRTAERPAQRLVGHHQTPIRRAARHAERLYGRVDVGVGDVPVEGAGGGVLGQTGGHQASGLPHQRRNLRRSGAGSLAGGVGEDVRDAAVGRKGEAQSALNLDLMAEAAENAQAHCLSIFRTCRSVKGPA